MPLTLPRDRGGSERFRGLPTLTDFDGLVKVAPVFPITPEKLRMSSKLLVASAALATALSAQATVSVTNSAFTYSQNFNSLAATGGTNAWVNDSTLAGWSLFIKDGVTAAPAYGTAASTTGGFFAFGSGSDRALGGTGSGGTYFGSPAAGAIAGWIAVAFTNTSAATLDSFTLRFDGEQWRNGGATSPAVSTAQTMKLEYGYGATMASVTTWIAPGGSFDFASPVFGTTAAAAVDGNVAGLVTGLGGTLATTWAPSSTLWVRWTELNDVGNDHSLAIDNVSLSVTAAAVPEASTYAMLLAGLGAVGFIARRRRG